MPIKMIFENNDAAMGDDVDTAADAKPRKVSKTPPRRRERI